MKEGDVKQIHTHTKIRESLKIIYMFSFIVVVLKRSKLNLIGIPYISANTTSNHATFPIQIYKDLQ